MAEQTEVKTVQYARRGDMGTLTLRGSVDIFEAQAIHAAAARSLADTKALTLSADLTAVHRLDLSALQILCGLRRDWEASGRTWTAQVPEMLAASLARTGFSL